jgi:hypothetical protein
VAIILKCDRCEEEIESAADITNLRLSRNRTPFLFQLCGYCSAEFEAVKWAFVTNTSIALKTPKSVS